jgi:hypothetical protein
MCDDDDDDAVVFFACHLFLFTACCCVCVQFACSGPSFLLPVAQFLQLCRKFMTFRQTTVVLFMIRIFVCVYAWVCFCIVMQHLRQSTGEGFSLMHLLFSPADFASTICHKASTICRKPFV